MPELDGAPLADVGSVLALATGNYGHFTAVRVDASRVRGLALHLERLRADCAELFGVPLDLAAVRASMRRVAASLEAPAMLRVTVFGAPGTRQPQVLISTRDVTPGGTSGLTVRTVDWVRDLPHVKHVGLFGQFHQRAAARTAGFDDALFVTPDGRLAEGPTWNLAAVLDGELVWPDDSCLPGITRRLLQELGPCSVRPLTRADLPRLTAAYATSAGIGLRPITRIDDVDLPGDEALRERLQASYAALPTDEL